MIRDYEDMGSMDRHLDYEELLNEYRKVKGMFHAAVRSNGGEMRIKDKDICAVHFDSKLIRYNDSENGCVVFKSQD